LIRLNKHTVVLSCQHDVSAVSGKSGVSSLLLLPAELWETTGSERVGFCTVDAFHTGITANLMCGGE
jgi:hypothetical protein